MRAPDERNRDMRLRAGAGLVFAMVLALALVLLLREPSTVRLDVGHATLHPELFGKAPSCSKPSVAVEWAQHLEGLASSRADRYLYDPRDGVRGVLNYREAAACYAAIRRLVDAHRVREAGRLLSHRVKTDYAAARLNLANAIEGKRWLDALRETDHLLLLTSHLGEHEYVEWLKGIIGQATAHAHESE